MRLLIPVVALAGLVSLGCGDDNEPLNPIAPLTSDAVVRYSVTASGDVTVTGVTYRDVTGTEVTVASPSLPWSEAFEAPSGTRISLAAQVTVNTSGSVEISMKAGGNGANVNEKVTRSATKAVSFALEIPAETLP